MKRFVIRNTETGEFLKGSGKHSSWTTLDKADLYKKKLSDFWWDLNMELVEVNITLTDKK